MNPAKAPPSACIYPSTDAINDPLSAERAQAVKAALVKAGIDASRVATRELGDSKPVASNQTEAGREKNRRIDVVVTKL